MRKARLQFFCSEGISRMRMLKRNNIFGLTFLFLAVSLRISAANNVTNATASLTSTTQTTPRTTTNLTSTTQTTPRTTTPTTLSPLTLKKIWCRNYFSSWSAPIVAGCKDPFHSTCSADVLNATNGYLVCKDLLEGNPSSKVISPMLLAGKMFDLGLQLAGYYADKRTITAEVEKYRLLRSHKSKILFEAGIAYKYSSRIWPDYKNKARFPTHKWNGRNDSILLPYATIPAGVFMYSFSLYDNLQDAALSKEAVRLKAHWRPGHLVTSGVFIDYEVEKGLIYNPKHVINTAIVSLALSPTPKSPVASNLTITLWHKKKGMFKPFCAYWQYVSPNDPSLRHHTGYWTNYGLTVIKTNDTTTICAASYIGMSTFAVIMEPYYDEPPEPTDPFTLATIILTVVSVLILIGYVAAMILLGCTRTKYSRMYIYIAVGCLLSQIVFLFALTKKDDWSMCTNLSIIMQLCHTTVMSWMMLESVHQLSRIRYFFNEEKSNIEAFYNVIGWGFPIAVIIALVGYPFDNFTDVRYCWIYVRGFDMWFFAGPLCALFVISVILRLITFYEIRKHPERLTRDINYQRAWRSLVASIFFLPLIAALWYIATIGVTRDKSESGIFLMCVPSFNAIVGVMVFIFYFYKNDEVHDALVEQRKIKEKRRLQRYEHLKGMKMKVKYLT